MKLKYMLVVLVKENVMLKCSDMDYCNPGGRLQENLGLFANNWRLG